MDCYRIIKKEKNIKIEELKDVENFKEKCFTISISKIPKSSNDAKLIQDWLSEIDLEDATYIATFDHRALYRSQKDIRVNFYKCESDNKPIEKEILYFTFKASTRLITTNLIIPAVN